MSAHWEDRIIGEDEVAPSSLLANPRNWRIHTDAQRASLNEAMDEIGWIQRVIVNQRTGFVVDGHLRVAQAIAGGEETIPILYVDLSEGEEGVILASLDSMVSFAVTDQDQLAGLLDSIELEQGPLYDAIDSLLERDEGEEGDEDDEEDSEDDLDTEPPPEEEIEIDCGKVIFGEFTIYIEWLTLDAWFKDLLVCYGDDGLEAEIRKRLGV